MEREGPQSLWQGKDRSETRFQSSQGNTFSQALMQEKAQINVSLRKGNQNHRLKDYRIHAPVSGTELPIGV